MIAPRVSVIIVSADRPDALLHCLKGVSQLIYESFEVIVIADKAGLGAINNSAFAGVVKSSLFEQSNISAARNKGLSLAAGKIVAFIDDDAVPEPGWLFHLVGPFRDPAVAAAGGFVRGRNGISYQWQASTVDSQCYETDLNICGDAPVVFPGSPERAVKTQGTNCAFRKDLLLEIGGFDPAFQFYLDETDLNMRLAAIDCLTAIVPLAEVHHSYLGSKRRLANRVPVSLFDIGASTAVFLRKYAKEPLQQDRIEDLIWEQKKTLIRHMVHGSCEPGDIVRLLSTLHAGIESGIKRTIQQPKKIDLANAPFLPFSATKTAAKQKIIAGVRLRSKKLMKEARNAVKTGNITSLYLFSRTALYHRVFFHEDGFWVQTGGIFGKSVRSEKLLSWYTKNDRLKKEMNRVAKVRYPADQMTNHNQQF